VERSRPIRVAIADDHALFRQGLKSLIGLRGDAEVVAETDHADGVAPMLAATPCDLLLLDLQMDRSSLVDVKSIAARVKVIVVTASERPEEALAAIRAGAGGLVFKRFAIESLMDAVRAVMDGHVWMPPALQARIATDLREPDTNALTSRERDVVRLVAFGLRNAEVAAKLFISDDTVKTHLNNVFQKLGVRDRVQLTHYAFRTGLIGIDDRV
jgi:DNA-binding NarL/FixJ family response regulator